MKRILAISILPAVIMMTESHSFIPQTTHTKEKPFKQPNVILIIADDLGYSDLASYGSTLVHTPHIDELGTNGIRFTHAYVSAPICAPSRMGIMTGRYQNRFGCEYMPYAKFSRQFIKDLHRRYLSVGKKEPGLKTFHPNFFVDKKKYNTSMAANEVILSELLKKNGYATGLIGKWNLGEDENNHPFQRGFDYSYYFDGALTRYVDDPVDTSRYINMHLPWAFSEMPAWTPRYGTSAIRENGKEVKDTGYLTFSFAKKGVEFIEKNKDHPFFLTLAFNAVHDPFQVPKDYFDRIQTTKDSVKRVYSGMIEALDDAVGAIMDKLKATGLDDNTIIFFISDNGGATYTRATDNFPLRGGKCTHFEGGLLVPFFIKYPAMISNGMVYNKAVFSLDIFSTIAAVTNTSLPADRTYDGVNLFPYLKSDTALPHNIIFWRSGYSKAIFKNNWKLYINEKNNKTFLFDITNDIEERKDLSSQMPDKVKELLNDLNQWEKTQTIHAAWPSAADVIIDVRGEKFRFPS